MSVEVLRPGVETEPLVDGEISLDRTDIRFFNTSPQRVALEVTFRNSSDGRSAPAAALIGSAPLGAFVAWRPVAMAYIPTLEPGESFIYRKDIDATTPAALGRPDRLPPRTLLTAIGASDPQRQRGLMAADLFKLMGQGDVHWAGNLNIFIGRHEVERHMAQALRVYPGNTNLAMFVVGDGKPDAYSFEVHGDGEAWGARLLDAGSAASIIDAAGSSDDLSAAGWRDMSSGVVLLALEPPADAVQGAVEVHVNQRSSGKTAVVEFALDARAAGPGCYVL
jgi:hypothetical protein